MADIGDMYRFGNPSQSSAAAAFTDINGVATDPTAVALTIVKPDLTALHYGYPSAGTDGTLIRESAGRYYADVAIGLAGTWRFRLAGTGAVTAASESSLRVARSRVS